MTLISRLVKDELIAKGDMGGVRHGGNRWVTGSVAQKGTYLHLPSSLSAS